MSRSPSEGDQPSLIQVRARPGSGRTPAWAGCCSAAACSARTARSSGACASASARSCSSTGSGRAAGGAGAAARARSVRHDDSTDMATTSTEDGLRRARGSGRQTPRAARAYSAGRRIRRAGWRKSGAGPAARGPGRPPRGVRTAKAPCRAGAPGPSSSDGVSGAGALVSPPGAAGQQPAARQRRPRGAAALVAVALARAHGPREATAERRRGPGQAGQQQQRDDPAREPHRPARVPGGPAEVKPSRCSRPCPRPAAPRRARSGARRWPGRRPRAWGTASGWPAGSTGR